MKLSNFVAIVGFGSVALSSLSASAYGQLDWSWTVGLWNGVQAIAPTINDLSLTWLNQLNNWVLRGEQSTTNTPINGRDRDCLNLITNSYQGFSSSAYQRFREDAITMPQSEVVAVLGHALCMVSNDTAIWLPDRPSGVLRVKFQNREVVGFEYVP